MLCFTRAVVLLTDGENNRPELPPLTAARLAQALGVRLYTIGVVSPTGLATPAGSAEVIEETLRAMAELTDGRYFRASDPDTLAQVYDTIDALERSRLGERRFAAFDELAPYLLAGALALLAAEVLLATFVLRRLP